MEYIMKVCPFCATLCHLHRADAKPSQRDFDLVDKKKFFVLTDNEYDSLSLVGNGSTNEEVERRLSYYTVIDARPALQSNCEAGMEELPEKLKAKFSKPESQTYMLTEDCCTFPATHVWRKPAAFEVEKELWKFSESTQPTPLEAMLHEQVVWREIADEERCHAKNYLPATDPNAIHRMIDVVATLHASSSVGRYDAFSPGGSFIEGHLCVDQADFITQMGDGCPASGLIEVAYQCLLILQEVEKREGPEVYRLSKERGTNTNWSQPMRAMRLGRLEASKHPLFSLRRFGPIVCMRAMHPGRKTSAQTTSSNGTPIALYRRGCGML
jgi:hypothetical protein